MAAVELTVDTSKISKTTIDDVKLALERLSKASEDQFQEIKNETWYIRLWDLVTFSKKNEIRLAEQISTLAQAQEVLGNILIVLSVQTQEISDLVREHADDIERLYSNDTYLLQRLKDLENEVYGYSEAIKVSELSPHNKAMLNSCIYYLSLKFAQASSADQRAYAGAIFSLANDGARTMGADYTEEVLTKNLPKVEPLGARKRILRCCFEYIFLYRRNEDDFEGDICKDIVAKSDAGPQMVKETERVVVEDMNLIGAERIIKNYENPTVSSVSDTFTIDLDLDLDAEAEPVLAQPHEFPEIEECIKEHTKDALLGESLPKKGQKSEKKQLTKEELLEILLPQNTPIAKTVVAITAAGEKTKKEKKKNDPLEYKEYLVFTTFALYHILNGEVSKIPYNQITPENTGTELTANGEDTFFCGEINFTCKGIKVKELERFCQKISKIENKPRSDVEPDLTEAETEAFFLGFSRIAASIIKGKDGRPLHELYRILTSDFGEDAMELWPVITENLDAPIEAEIDEWKNALIYPLEEMSCSSLVYYICRGILYSKGSNEMSFEDAHILHLISDSDDDIDAMQRAAQSERKKILQYIDGSDDSTISTWNKAIKELLASYDRAISAAKRFGEVQIQEKLENTLKQLEAKRVERIDGMERAGFACIEKWSKRALKIGFIPGGCMPFVHGICSKMLKELNEIFKLPTSKRIDDNAFVDAIVGAIMTPFMVIPIISAAAATGYVTQVGEEYLKALVTVIEKSTEDELENADLLEKRLQIALQERAESANESPKS